MQYIYIYIYIYAVRVCSRIFFFLCASWSGAWPILNARRLTLWNAWALGALALPMLPTSLIRESTQAGGRRRRPPPFVEAARSAASFMDGCVGADEAADVMENFEVCIDMAI